jgi:hypothetical protein
MSGVMAHTGFGDVTIIRASEGISIIVPQNQIVRRGKRAGQLKKNVATKLNDLSLENLTELNKRRGIVFNKVDSNLVLAGGIRI